MTCKRLRMRHTFCFSFDKIELQIFNTQFIYTIIIISNDIEISASINELLYFLCRVSRFVGSSSLLAVRFLADVQYSNSASRTSILFSCSSMRLSLQLQNPHLHCVLLFLHLQTYRWASDTFHLL